LPAGASSARNSQSAGCRKKSERHGGQRRWCALARDFFVTPVARAAWREQLHGRWRSPSQGLEACASVGAIDGQRLLRIAPDEPVDDRAYKLADRIVDAALAARQTAGLSLTKWWHAATSMASGVTDTCGTKPDDCT